MICQVRFQVKQRLNLEIGSLRIFGSVRDFQNKLTAVSATQAKILITLADQRFQLGLKAIVLPDNVDDFAAEFGYEKPSEALRVYEACKNEADQLQKLFNDKECQQLSEIA